MWIPVRLTTLYAQRRWTVGVALWIDRVEREAAFLLRRISTRFAAKSATLHALLKMVVRFCLNIGLLSQLTQPFRWMLSLGV